MLKASKMDTLDDPNSLYFPSLPELRAIIR
jgi:hypothetical protein